MFQGLSPSSIPAPVEIAGPSSIPVAGPSGASKPTIAKLKPLTQAGDELKYAQYVQEFSGEEEDQRPTLTFPQLIELLLLNDSIKATPLGTQLSQDDRFKGHLTEQLKQIFNEPPFAEQQRNAFAENFKEKYNALMKDVRSIFQDVFIEITNVTQNLMSAKLGHFPDPDFDNIQNHNPRVFDSLSKTEAYFKLLNSYMTMPPFIEYKPLENDKDKKEEEKKEDEDEQNKKKPKEKDVRVVSFVEEDYVNMLRRMDVFNMGFNQGHPNFLSATAYILPKQWRAHWNKPEKAWVFQPTYENGTNMQEFLDYWWQCFHLFFRFERESLQKQEPQVSSLSFDAALKRVTDFYEEQQESEMSEEEEKNESDISQEPAEITMSQEASSDVPEEGAGEGEAELSLGGGGKPLTEAQKAAKLAALAQQLGSSGVTFSKGALKQFSPYLSGNKKSQDEIVAEAVHGAKQKKQGGQEGQMEIEGMEEQQQSTQQLKKKSQSKSKDKLPAKAPQNKGKSHAKTTQQPASSSSSSSSSASSSSASSSSASSSSASSSSASSSSASSPSSASSSPPKELSFFQKKQAEKKAEQEKNPNYAKLTQYFNVVNKLKFALCEIYSAFATRDQLFKLLERTTLHVKPTEPLTLTDRNKVLPSAKRWYDWMVEKNISPRFITLTQTYALNYIAAQPSSLSLRLPKLCDASVLNDVKVQYANGSQLKLLQDVFDVIELKGCKKETITSTSRKKLEKMMSDMITDFAVSPAAYSNSHINVLLTGAAGAGKTRFAGLIANVMKHCGLLISPKPIDTVSKADLVGEYVGQSAPKTKRRLFQNLENVLFIDEAYALADKTTNAAGKEVWDSYGVEVMTEIVNFLDKYKGRICIIAAGYEKPMRERFLKINEGLPRRFPFQVHLPNYSPVELVALFCYFLAKNQTLTFPFVDTDALDFLTAMTETWEKQLFPNSAGDMENFASVAGRILLRKRSQPGNENQPLTVRDMQLAALEYCGTMRNTACFLSDKPASAEWEETEEVKSEEDEEEEKEEEEEEVSEEQKLADMALLSVLRAKKYEQQQKAAEKAAPQQARKRPRYEGPGGVEIVGGYAPYSRMCGFMSV